MTYRFYWQFATWATEIVFKPILKGVPILYMVFAVTNLPITVFFLQYSLNDIFYYLMQIFLMGMVFAYVFARRQTLVPTMVAHALWNFSNVVVV